MGRKNPRVRKPLSWDMRWDGNPEVLATEGSGTVMSRRLALAYFLLLFRAPELLVYESGMVHPDSGFARRDLAYFRGIRR